LGGLLGSLGGEAAEAAESAAQRQQQGGDDFSQVVAAIDSLRQEIARGTSFSEITAVREAQKAFLRVNQHLPNFIDVGPTHWFNVYDWHVRWQQALTLGRDSLGRLTITYLGTTIVLRMDMTDSYMSTPYDER
jgi:hypothetical protein